MKQHFNTIDCKKFIKVVINFKVFFQYNKIKPVLKIKQVFQQFDVLNGIKTT